MALFIISDAYGYDRALAALFCGAKNGQTVSQMAALAARDDKKWGCVLCSILSRMIEPDHCEQSLNGDQPTSQPAALRSGILLLLGAAVPFSYLCWLMWHTLFLIISAI